jgi:hypothetical protein
MAAPNIPTFGLAIDWETSGYSHPNYASKHQGISFGAIIFEIKTLEPIETLYHEIKFDPKFEWSSGAEKVHGLTREHLAKHGISQEDAAFSLSSAIIKYIGTEDIVLLGHRVYFDKAFTQQLTESQGIFLNYHPTMIDSCSMGTLLLEASRSDEVFDLMGLPPRSDHNSLEDIMYTLESIRKMKDYFIKGLLASL